MRAPVVHESNILQMLNKEAEHSGIVFTLEKITKQWLLKNLGAIIRSDSSQRERKKSVK